MIAARLLDANEVLGRHLDCEACERDERRKRHLGCGVQPAGGWDALSWLSQHGAKEAPRAPYRFANLGEVSDFGWLWPCCPKYFARFAAPSALAEAEDALELRWWAEEGTLSLVVNGTLSYGTAELLRFAVVFGRHARGVRERHEAEKRKREIEAAQKRGGRR